MKKRTALITGGSSGLGLALAELLTMQNYEVILIARNQARLDTAVSKMEKLGGTAYGYSADISCEEQMNRIYEDIKTNFEKIDFLILNAGIVSVGSLKEQSIENLRKDIFVDLWGTILSAKLFNDLLPNHSKILMISSALGMIGLAGYPSYCAAKSGIINFSKVLRRELLSRKINVYIACPADIATPSYENEMNAMPAWMKMINRPNLISPELAAKRILDKCRGKQQMILINKEILLLYYLEKFLPVRLMDFILDKMFPYP